MCATVALCVALCAVAEAKPKIAILGLEAVPAANGTVDPATTQVARAITRELRQRAQSAASPYAIAPNSSKELTDEKLLMSCDNEAASCMAVIGAGLAADVMLYGRVEKRGDTYRVSLKRLDVKARTVQSGGEEVAVGSGVAGMAKRLYVKLVGEAEAVGTLAVRATTSSGAPVAAGNVTIDEEPRGKLDGGRLTVAGLSEGRHVLAIEVGGYARFEETVTIHSGDQATLNALLIPRDAARPAAGGAHGSAWKWALGTSLVVAAVGGGMALTGYLEQQNYIGKVTTRSTSGDPQVRVVTSGDCGTSATKLKAERMIEFDDSKFDTACTWHNIHYAGFVVLGVGGVGALLSMVMVIRDAHNDEPPRRVSLSPAASPGYAGASLSVRW